MKQIGFLFPGQGAQYVGMGLDFYQNDPAAKSLFDRADQILGFPLTKLCFEGPEEELTRTVNTQTSIFVTSLAILEAFRGRYPQMKPALACGLSLGEFTALVALNAMSFVDGLKLVQKRAQLMEQAGQNRPGTMASIMGLCAEACEQICREAGCVAANFNTPEQTVISGSVETVTKACQLAEAKGAKRALLLKVGGAFHSPLMKEAEDGLRQVLANTQIVRPSAYFIPNVTAEPTSDPESIRSLLAAQLTSPVRWVKSMNTASSLGIVDYLELGPGKVLKGLARKIGASLSVCSIEKIENLESAKELLQEVTNAS